MNKYIMEATVVHRKRLVVEAESAELAKRVVKEYCRRNPNWWKNAVPDEEAGAYCYEAADPCARVSLSQKQIEHRVTLVKLDGYQVISLNGKLCYSALCELECLAKSLAETLGTNLVIMDMLGTRLGKEEAAVIADREAGQRPLELLG